MSAFAAAVHGKRDGEAEDEETADRVVPLPWSWATCTELWKAWREHGVMPRSGGYLDQPRAWQRMIHFLNARYGLAAQEHQGAGRGESLDDFLSGITGSVGELGD